MMAKVQTQAYQQESSSIDPMRAQRLQRDIKKRIPAQSPPALPKSSPSNRRPQQLVTNLSAKPSSRILQEDMKNKILTRPPPALPKSPPSNRRPPQLVTNLSAKPSSRIYDDVSQPAAPNYNSPSKVTPASNSPGNTDNNWPQAAASMEESAVPSTT